MPYILEAQHFFINGNNTHPEWNGKKEHIGYINKIFTTKLERAGAESVGERLNSVDGSRRS